MKRQGPQAIRPSSTPGEVPGPGNTTRRTGKQYKKMGSAYQALGAARTKKYLSWVYNNLRGSWGCRGFVHLSALRILAHDLRHEKRIDASRPIRDRSPRTSSGAGGTSRVGHEAGGAREASAELGRALSAPMSGDGDCTRGLARVAKCGEFALKRWCISEQATGCSFQSRTGSESRATLFPIDGRRVQGQGRGST